VTRSRLARAGAAVEDYLPGWIVLAIAVELPAVASLPAVAFGLVEHGNPRKNRAVAEEGSILRRAVSRLAHVFPDFRTAGTGFDVREMVSCVRSLVFVVGVRRLRQGFAVLAHRLPVDDRIA
jgi:hypothetical protein